MKKLLKGPTAYVCKEECGIHYLRKKDAMNCPHDPKKLKREG